MDIESLIAEVDALPPRAALARETARLRRDELHGSLVITGSPLSRVDVSALVDGGRAIGGHPLDAYLAARNLSHAYRWIAEQRPYAHDRDRPLVAIEEVRRLHMFVTAGLDAARPGQWRLAVTALRNDLVAPPPWMVPLHTAGLVDRFRHRPAPGTLVASIVEALARFARIQPFHSANGRTGRLVAALIVRRLDAPPMPIAPDAAQAYSAAILRAESGTLAPLAALVERGLAESAHRLIAAAGETGLVPLRELAGDDYAALIKAAQRRRLRTVTRSRRIYSTAAWIAAYRNGNG